MRDPLPILPPRGVRRVTVRPPGSKSITNRALLLAALAAGRVELEGALWSDDTRVMASGLRELGFDVAEDHQAARVTVLGRGGYIPNRRATLQVGNAGTAARFLTALTALSPEGDFYFDGVPQMRRRPMKGLLEALRAGGAQVESENGSFPLRVRGGFQGGDIPLDASESSQLLSALLLIGPCCAKPLRLRLTAPTVSAPFVAMTLAMQAQFGQRVPPEWIQAWQEGRGTPTIDAPRGQPYTSAERYVVEPDATAASYWLALPIACPELTVHVVGMPRSSLQGDVRFADELARTGLCIRHGQGVLTSCAGKTEASAIEADFSDISDTFLTLAAVAPLLRGSTRILGIGHTRHQETDRIAAMAAELRRVGQDVDEGPDWLRVRPRPLQQAVIRTYHDHRVAMSFAILGCHDLRGDATPWLSIADPGCCAKTYPDFFGELERVRVGAEAHG